MKNNFSVIIPVYNEERIIEKSINQLFGKLDTIFKRKNYEVVVCENGSTDKTYKILTALCQKYANLKIIKLKPRSYGKALKAGIIKAKYNRVIIVNADYYDTQFIKKCVELLDGKSDLIIGSKCHPQSIDERPLHRRLLTKGFNWLLRLSFRLPVTDTHGLKAFIKTSAIMEIIYNSCISDELFDTELVIKAHKTGLKIKELPVTVRELRPTRYNFFQRAYISLKEFMTIFLNLKIKT